MHIDNSRSQVDLDRGLDQGLLRDPVGEVGRHELLEVEVENAIGT